METGQNSRNWFRNNKRLILHWLYIAVGITTVIIPLLVHQQTADCVNRGIRSILHYRIFHIENYSCELVSPYFQFHFKISDYEIWELYAIIQAALFSFILIFEPDQKIGIRAILLTLFAVIILCPLAIVFLGLRVISLYQLALFLILVLFSLGDVIMWKKTRDKEYRLLCFYVDIPILFAFTVLTSHVGLPVKDYYSFFFSGAIAFQLILGNILIFFIRSHTEIEGDLGVAKTLKKVFLKEIA